jgi:amino acid adenylation domain-containing protein
MDETDRTTRQQTSRETMPDRFGIVTNDDGHVSIWPTDRTVPAGWTAQQITGSRDECLRAIEERWPAGRTERRLGTTVPGDTVLSRFTYIALRAPDQAAAGDGTERLSYAGLRSRARAVAQALVANGVRPGDRVVLYLPRGVRMIAGMLGVLEAGAAYVPIDVRYPQARRDLMIRTGRATIIVTEDGWAESLGELGVPTLEWKRLIDREETPDGGAAPETSMPVVTAGDVACILFTSGSTGMPKAVQLAHRNLLYFAANPLVPMEAGDRTAQVSSVSFDAVHFEIWCSLVRGAEVEVLPSFADLVADGLPAELERRRISVLFAPTMAMNHLVYEDRDTFAGLRFLCTGGDVLQLGACRELLAGRFAGTFLNIYGPTEVTTACTSYRVEDLPPDATTVPIGTPFEGAHVYVLDPSLREMPCGETGEIHIGGAGVTLGYLGQPALTAERFLPDPFQAPGSRMYASGDFGRRRADGTLEFVGRRDDQVKIRGYRVEPREVESAVAGHPDVRETVVIAAGQADDKRLVAFVVTRRPVAPDAVRAYAERVLPDYMVPRVFVRVPGIPSDAHGKRDLAGLRKLAIRHARRTAGLVPPQDETEGRLAQLWEGLLGIEWIGRDDDFFDLGGNSLLAFRLQRRIERELGVSVEPRQIIATGRLADLAALITAASAGKPRGTVH